MRFTGLSQYLDKEVLRSTIQGWGHAGPFVFLAIFMIGTMLFLPGSVFIALAAVVFGTLWGFILVLLGHILGATLTFFIARYLGHDFVKNLKISMLRKYDKKLEKHGFATVLYFRLLFCPFTPFNVAAGLSSISFAAYFWASLFGMIPSTFVLTFFFDKITDIHSFGDVLTPQVFFAGVLFIGALCIPKILKSLPKDMKRRLNIP